MLQQGREQLRSHLDALPGTNRHAVLAIAVVLLASGLFYVTRSSATAECQALFGGRHLRQVEMDQVELAFSSAGLGEWRREGDRMMVPTGKRHLYLAAIQQASALPYTLQSSVERSLAGSSYFESDSARKQRHEFAKAQDLGAKIAAFGDIAWASVDYDEQPAHGFETKPIRSASVVVVSEDDRPLPAERLRMIQEFVRASYAGMAEDDVVITDTSTGRVSANDQPIVLQDAPQDAALSSSALEPSVTRKDHSLDSTEPVTPETADTSEPLMQLLILLAPIAAIVIVGFAILFAAFRMRMRSSANSQPSFDAVADEVALAVHSEEQGHDEHSMREELADLIESNPELAAQIVHGWLADAA